MEIDSLIIRNASAFQRLFTYASHRNGYPANTADCGALNAAKLRLPTADRIGCDPALPIRRTRQRNRGPLAGEKVAHFNGIPNRPNLRVRRAHLRVNANTSALAQFETRIASQSAFRAHTD